MDRKPKRGDRFIHARYLDNNNKPQIRVVTAIRTSGIDILIYHKAEGASKAGSFFKLAEINKSVKKWL